MTSPKGNRTGTERKATIEAAIRTLEQGEVMLTPREATRAIGCGETWLRDGANHRDFGKFPAIQPPGLLRNPGDSP